jgi:hypothetical protein
VVIEPGGINTEWGGIAKEKLGTVSGTGPYADQAGAVAQSLTSETNRRRQSPPTVIADTIVKAVTSPLSGLLDPVAFAGTLARSCGNAAGQGRAFRRVVGQIRPGAGRRLWG